MPDDIQIYIGDTLLQSQTWNFLNPNASRDPIDIALKRLTPLGDRLAALFVAMRPDVSILEGEASAEAFELEVGFTLEMEPGGLLKLIISPTVGLSCKATMTWRRR